MWNTARLWFAVHIVIGTQRRAESATQGGRPLRAFRAGGWRVRQNAVRQNRQMHRNRRLHRQGDGIANDVRLAMRAGMTGVTGTGGIVVARSIGAHDELACTQHVASCQYERHRGQQQHEKDDEQAFHQRRRLTESTSQRQLHANHPRCVCRSGRVALSISAMPCRMPQSPTGCSCSQRRRSDASEARNCFSSRMRSSTWAMC